jgi:glutamyl-tRNA synthetase
MVDFLFLDDLEVEPSLLVPKRWDIETTVSGLHAARVAIAELGEVSFEADELEATLRTLCETHGWKAGDLFMAVRVAITWLSATPPLIATMASPGHARTLERLDTARALLEGSRT